MDIAMWAEMVQSLGLPIVLIGAMGWFIFKLWKQSAEREAKLYDELAECRKVNDKAIAAIAQCAEKIGDVQEDVKEMKNNITKIVARIEHE